MRAPKLYIRQAPATVPTMTFADYFRQRLSSVDHRSTDEFLADMRAKQAAGQLNNPTATGPLLDRLAHALGKTTHAT